MKRLSARRLWAVAKKEMLHVVRDVRSLGMAIALPMLMLVLFGYALTLDVDNVPLVVWDQSGTPASRELVSRFTGSRYFSLLRYVGNYEEVVSAIDRREALAGLVVPADFGEGASEGGSREVQFLVDGSNANTATIALGYGEAITKMYWEVLAFRAVRRVGGTMPDAPMEIRSRVWFNEEMESKNYIVPGLIAVIMMVIAAQLTSLTVAREWEQGTMEQLVSTPVRGPELILGKLLPYLGLGMLDMTLAVLMGVFVFGVPLRGIVVLLFGVATFFTGC